MLAGGFSARFIDSERQSMGASSICFECPAGVFARVLFYAQYLPFLGSMVEVSVHLLRKTKRHLFLTDYVVNVDTNLDHIF